MNTKRPVRVAVILAGCIAVNLLGKHLAASLQLPLWLDALGTVFAAYVLGPVYGAVAGAAVNVIYTFLDPTSIIYSLTSISIGLSMGYAARRRYFESFFGATSVAGGVTFISVVVSTILNIAIYDGATGNIWGDGVKDFLMENHVPWVLSSAIGEMYLDFLDKLVTVLGMYFLIKLYRRIRKRRGISVGAISMLLLPLITVTFIASLSHAPYVAMAAVDHSDSTSYIRRVYDADNGLACGHANDVAFTQDGILWVASYAGLYRYNGRSFRFMSEYDAVKNANCLYVDGDGWLWIGTNDNGIVVAYDEKLIDTLGSLRGLPSDSVRSIVQSSDGDYYIGTSDSMCVITRRDAIDMAGVIDEVHYAQSLSADHDGRVAAVTAEGRLFILKERRVLYEVQRDTGVQFSACAFDEEGRLFVGTTGGDVLIYSVGPDGTTTLETTIPCEGQSKLNQIYFTDDAIWLLADNGIGTLYNGVFSREQTDDFNSSIQRMSVDQDGGLWFASSRHGLLQLLETDFTDIFAEHAIKADVVNSTAIRGELLYVGTDSGLTIIHMPDGELIYDELTDILTGSRVRCIRSDSQGALWICSYGEGLLRLDADGTISSYVGEDYQIGNRVRICMELSDSTIAAGSDVGLTLIRRDGESVTIPYGDEMGSSQILSMCELPDGRLFLGTDGNGIVVLSDEVITEHITQEDGLSSGVILRLVQDGDSAMFIVTSNSLCYMDADGIRVLSSFPYSNNYDIVLDDDGEMFVSGSAGIYVLDKATLLAGGTPQYLLLDTRKGLTGALTANSWNALSADKDLYLSTDRGVFRMNLDAYRSEPGSRSVKVKGVRVDGKSVAIDRGSVLTIGRNTNSIEFIPEVVNYTLEDAIISYYLEGIDDSYKNVSQSELSSVIYTNLPPGEYVFRLAIYDEDDGSVTDESAFRFVKDPAIYDNWWFILYMLIVGGLFVGWFTWFLTRYGLQRTLALQQERLSLALKQVQMGNETILAIAKTVDAKDAMTSRHSQRVSDYSVMIARQYGFSPEEQENLRKAALLHDIGKIGIPDAILNKPARLSDEEYAVMKTHVTRGAEILKDFTLVEHVVDGARYHHERYDGRGYPDGLSGDAIPLYGRIIAIADAFDAMTANRVYRNRLTPSRVMEELRGGRGTQFDPGLLDIFLGLIERGEIDMEALYSGPGSPDPVKGA